MLKTPPRMHHIVINAMVVIIVVFTFVSYPTIILLYDAFMLIIQNSLISRALWLP